MFRRVRGANGHMRRNPSLRILNSVSLLGSDVDGGDGCEEFLVLAREDGTQVEQ
jgi:hypothetical protein